MDNFIALILFTVTTLHILWEVMHPKLNDSFMGNVTTLEGFATIPHQYTIWLELIEKIISVNVNELSNKTSFELFLCILSDNLSDESSRAVKMTSQFFGRVRSKLVSIALTFLCLFLLSSVVL